MPRQLVGEGRSSCSEFPVIHDQRPGPRWRLGDRPSATKQPNGEIVAALLTGSYNQDAEAGEWTYLLIPQNPALPRSQVTSNYLGKMVALLRRFTTR
jgi:hypothetical protein